MFAAEKNDFILTTLSPMTTQSTTISTADTVTTATITTTTPKNDNSTGTESHALKKNGISKKEKNRNYRINKKFGNNSNRF